MRMPTPRLTLEQLADIDRQIAIIDAARRHRLDRRLEQLPIDHEDRRVAVEDRRATQRRAEERRKAERREDHQQ